MLNDGESYTFEDKTYVTPTVSRDEQLEFIENLKATQEQGNQDIRTQTRNLGTDIPLNQGGLTGADSYFTQRYQAPQTETLVSQLRTAAQASALNNVLSDLQSQYKERYNQAYRGYQKRKARSSSGSGNGTAASDGNTVSGSVSEQSTGDGGITVNQGDITATSNPKPGVSDTTVFRDGQWVTQYSDGTYTVNGKSASSGSGGGTISSYEKPQDTATTSLPFWLAAGNAALGNPIPMIGLGLSNLINGNK